MTMEQNERFEQWLKQVDDFVQRYCGLDTSDLPDCNYRDWYEDGDKPATAAKRAIRMAKGGDK
jgi:hypothetical protein